MTRADLIDLRDAAALDFEQAQSDYQRTGQVWAYLALEAARRVRREAQDAVDALDKTEATS